MRILSIILLLFLCSCNHVKTIKAPPSFNYDGFSRIEKSSKTYSDITFDNADYESSSIGTVYVRSCIEVENTNPDIFTGREYNRYMHLVADCYSIKKYYSAAPYEKSYFPKEISADFILSLPALTVVNLSGQLTEKEMGKGKSLVKFDPETKVLRSSKYFTRILTQSDMEIDYYIMARGDFNNDNIEDLVLKTNWRIRSAFGSGAEVITITKVSNDSDIEIIDRFWTFWPGSSK